MNIFKMLSRNAANKANKNAIKVANDQKAEMLVGKTFNCKKVKTEKQAKHNALLANPIALIMGATALNVAAPKATVVKTVAEKPVVEVKASETKVEDEIVEEIIDLFDEFDDFEEITFEVEDDGEPVNFGEIAEMLGEIEEEIPASETIEGFVTFEEIEAELEEDIRIFDENGNAIGEDCGCIKPDDFENSISAMLEGKEDDLDWFSEYEVAEMLGEVDKNFEEYGDFVLQFGEEIGVSELLILNLAFKQGVMPCEIRKTFRTDDSAIYEAWCNAWKPHLKYDYLRSYFDLKTK